jgi:SAM-dependent methyltransferase
VVEVIPPTLRSPRAAVQELYQHAHWGVMAGASDPRSFTMCCAGCLMITRRAFSMSGVAPATWSGFFARMGLVMSTASTYSEEQVALAAERAIAGIEHAELHAHLGSRHQTYDVILALDVLEHFNNSEVMPVLDLVAAALRPGGVLVARTPNATSPFMGRYRYGTSRMAVPSPRAACVKCSGRPDSAM